MGIEKGATAIGEDCEVVAFDIEKRKDYVFPAVVPEQMEIFLGAVAVNGIARVYQVDRDVIPEGLESGNREWLDGKQLRECVCACDAEREYLPKVQFSR